MTEIVWPTKLKVFTVCPFIEKLPPIRVKKKERERKKAETCSEASGKHEKEIMVLIQNFILGSCSLSPGIKASGDSVLQKSFHSGSSRYVCD